MDNFDLKKFLIENKLTPSSLKEEQIRFFSLKDVTKTYGMDQPRTPLDKLKMIPVTQMTDLKVGLNVIPSLFLYRDAENVRQEVGKIIKIDGDNIIMKKNDGKKYTYPKSGVIHVTDL
jgi:hypothetical protein